jgi:hypothetical protein
MTAGTMIDVSTAATILGALVGWTIGYSSVSA